MGGGRDIWSGWLQLRLHVTNLPHIIIRFMGSVSLKFGLLVSRCLTSMRWLFSGLFEYHSFFISRWHCFPILSYSLPFILSENN